MWPVTHVRDVLTVHHATCCSQPTLVIPSCSLCSTCSLLLVLSRKSAYITPCLPVSLDQDLMLGFSGSKQLAASHTLSHLQKDLLLTLYAISLLHNVSFHFAYICRFYQHTILQPYLGHGRNQWELWHMRSAGLGVTIPILFKSKPH